MITTRVTIDLDNKNKLKLKYVCLKGRMLCHKPADRIYATRRGYHLIWDSLPITMEKSFALRRMIGDDTKRLKLDSQGNRLKNVLFSSKKITYLEEGFITKQEEFIRRRIK